MSWLRNRDRPFWINFVIVFGSAAVLVSLLPVTRNSTFAIHGIGGWLTFIALLCGVLAAMHYCRGCLRALLGKRAQIDENSLLGQILKHARPLLALPIAIGLGSWLAPTLISCTSLLGLTLIWFTAGAACGVCEYLDKRRASPSRD